jgi:hypothetical protein
MSSETFSRLVELGHGTNGSGNLLPELGSLLWIFNDASSGLRIYELGLVSEEASDLPHTVLFSEIDRVESSLNVERLARTYQNFTGHERLPMSFLKVDGQRYEISVPLRFYSTLLQALVAKAEEGKSLGSALDT